MTDMGWTLLSSQLHRECGLMELLLFKLQQEHLMLAAGQDRWLAHATAEVNLVMAELQQVSGSRTAISLSRRSPGSGPSSRTWPRCGR